jgi:hypothetical protein
MAFTHIDTKSMVIKEHHNEGKEKGLLVVDRKSMVCFKRLFKAIRFFNLINVLAILGGRNLF